MKITQLTKLVFIIFALGGLAACSSTSEAAATDSSQTETSNSSESGQSAAEAAAAAAEERARRSALATRIFYFDFDVSEFRGSERDVLTYHARDLAANPSKRVRLEGHADERGTREYNLALGERRARDVRRLVGDVGPEDALGREALGGGGGGDVRDGEGGEAEEP